MNIMKLIPCPTPWKQGKSGAWPFKLAVLAGDGGSVCHITDWTGSETVQNLIKDLPELLDDLADIALRSKDFPSRCIAQNGLARAFKMPWKDLKELIK